MAESNLEWGGPSQHPDLARQPAMSHACKDSVGVSGVSRTRKSSTLMGKIADACYGFSVCMPRMLLLRRRSDEWTTLHYACYEFSVPMQFLGR